MSKLLYSGKVRDVYEYGDNHLLMKASDRVSAFDRNIGIIPGKGKLLNKMNQFWFWYTRHIIDNHFVSNIDDGTVAIKCTPFLIEVIVRGYITGGLWARYSKGEREYCGVKFPDGLQQHQKLPEPVVTPTTKGITDEPISREDIIKDGYMTKSECAYIFDKALELFEYGQFIADAAELILVDTKYEFGKDKDGKILLIDELHTCDSSRYWLKDTYQELLEEKKSPEGLDKDCVREWVKGWVGSGFDPHDQTIPIPEIPQLIVIRAYNAYSSFYDRITSVGPVCFDNVKRLFNGNLVVILSGSVKDELHVAKLMAALSDQSIDVKSFVASAHKNTKLVLDIIQIYDKGKKNIVWVTVAGRSNALSGVVAANSKFPVIACPPFVDKMDMMVNIHSTLQCPSNVPVMTILEPVNVALSIKRMFQFAK